MKKAIKNIKLIGFVILMGVLFSTVGANAQSPADDPGIGGPGSPGDGPGGDGGPVVPLDRDLSILLISVGIAYGYKKITQQQSMFGIK